MVQPAKLWFMGSYSAVEAMRLRITTNVRFPPLAESSSLSAGDNRGPFGLIDHPHAQLRRLLQLRPRAGSSDDQVGLGADRSGRSPSTPPASDRTTVNLANA